MAGLFARLVELLGKRLDDPAVVAFHEAEGLPPPPRVAKADTGYDVTDEARAFTLSYCATVNRAELYPPRREGGRFVGYLAYVTFAKAFDLPLTESTRTGLPEEQARALARSTWETPLFRGHVVWQDGTRRLELLYDTDDGSFCEARLGLEVLEDDSPELARLAAAARGVGPLEAIEQGAIQGEARPAIARIAATIEARADRSADEILAAAADGYGDIADRVRDLNRHG
jgi:hypothetical protein